MSLPVPVEGSRVTASGVVELLDGRPPRLDFRPGTMQRRPRPPGTPCSAGIDVPGLDASQVGARWITVVGTLRAGAIDVAEQHDLPRVERSPRLRVPCPEPVGGWAPGGEPFDDRSPDDAAHNAFLAQHQDMIGRLFLLKPAPDRQVAAVVARDEAERDMAVRELTPAFRGRLCVVVADDDVDAAPRAMADLNTRRIWGLMSAGSTAHEDLRRRVHVELMWVTDEALAFQAAHPEGVVVLDPHLRVIED